VDARFGIAKHTILVPDLVDDRTPTRRVVFTEHALKIAG
jgi:hypothetical protein